MGGKVLVMRIRTHVKKLVTPALGRQRQARIPGAQGQPLCLVCKPQANE